MKKPKPVPKTDTCVYAGRRFNGRKVNQLFIRSNGEEMYFSGVSGVTLGATYRCSSESISKRPERVYDAELIDNARWDAEDALVSESNARKRAETKFAKGSSPALKAALAALRPLCADLDIFEINSLVKYLVSKAQKK